PGIMQAATRGAAAVGGKSVAVTFNPKDMPEFEGRNQENNVNLEFTTANYIERMWGLIYYADLFICFKGGTGTLSEWTTAWLLAHLYYGNHKPLILYGDFWFEVIDVISRHFFIDQKEKNVFKIVTNKAELLTAISELEEQIAARN
ncbi:MAG TPA: LOG family protein, partial [Candidatus Woesebacteria bacterium]|nr:LOG family protein [Candidatus Woesebacteria bacterium]